ncbi:s-methyl-5-thioribose-1-phosphate isomerase [Herpetosiphon sp. NSE202]|uniref:s-methyl-5-thioribose-1-phosphate isomerase n=1 Tax=Herpetosiphon sp. NSE202 TaxID=3351349 RepID=UPI00363AC02A
MTGRLPLLTRRGDTLRYDREKGIVSILNRRLYPAETVWVDCADLEAVAQAIETMVIQGGPPLAYAAGYGLALALDRASDYSLAEQQAVLGEALERLRRTRPTADDLHTILAEAERLALQALNQNQAPNDAVYRYVAGEIQRGDRSAERCGVRAAELLTDGDTILTVCYPGAAFNWMLYTAVVKHGKQVAVMPTETRPYGQGIRLTASQALEIGSQVTVINDNMSGFCFSRDMISVYITAADRIALDGSIANKVGTYTNAVLAKRHGVPFYVLGYDGPDINTPTGAEIPIEERNGDEVLMMNGQRIAPAGVRGYYPAFDVTPPELISSIVTDRGIYRPAMIQRYLDDSSDAPLDVIPLLG